MDGFANAQRAVRGHYMVNCMVTEKEREGSDSEDLLGDALADLMHFADRNDVDFDVALQRAFGHFNDETV